MFQVLHDPRDGFLRAEFILTPRWSQLHSKTQLPEAPVQTSKYSLRFFSVEPHTCICKNTCAKINLSLILCPHIRFKCALIVDFPSVEETFEMQMNTFLSTGNI